MVWFPSEPREGVYGTEQVSERPAAAQLTFPNEPFESVEKLILPPDAKTDWPVASLEVAEQMVRVLTDKVEGEHRTVVRL
jgi:hypothetical protein